jgi:hypothetical protein
MMTLPIIGRKDKADFPSLEIKSLDVKIDSGAYSCSIHCDQVEVLEIEGKVVLEVIFLDKDHPKYTGKKHYFEDYKIKKVKSSTGYQQERYFIPLELKLFGESFVTDFSITSRNGLRNPVLLGRKLLNKQFLIDSSKTNLSYRLMKLKKNNSQNS